jgi:hypothetical protein
MIVCAHQPNFLPGESVLEKIARSDVCIWLDEVEYTHGGYTNRNRLPDGRWLTVPVCAGSGDATRIKDVKIAATDWHADLVRLVEETHPDPSDALQALATELTRPYGLLVGLNLGILEALLPMIGIRTSWRFQSHLDGGRAWTAQVPDATDTQEASARLARMCDEIGATTYLAGGSGRKYMTEEPFSERGIAVEYTEYRGKHPSLLTLAHAETLIPWRARRGDMVRG